ncbi:LacI family DNA-binding transcriptional regulator [Nonomuraea rubra]|uniref:LacI family DNA-binding transcriptional regulator n=1 Tax=Nonomuraea rubra TaxID=46180 RepID=UPI0033E8A1F8
MNIGEIARRAGVSRSTVSYALSGKRAVSEVTRRRILQVIDDVGYRPNASAVPWPRAGRGRSAWSSRPPGDG